MRRAQRREPSSHVAVRRMRDHRTRSRPADRRAAVVDVHHQQDHQGPLDLDATLVGDGTGTALDSASLSTDHVVVNQNVPLVSQQQISVESPANADVVTLQVGSSLRRTDKQKDSGLLLAIVDTVTLNRKTALAVSDDTHTGGSVQKPRAVNDENPPTAMPCGTTGCRTGFRSTPRRRPIPTSIRSPRSRSTSTTTPRKTSTG